MVNIIHDFLCVCCTMRSNQVILDPGNEVIFECALDHLMEKIGRNEFMNVCSRKIVGEWLSKKMASVDQERIDSNNMMGTVEEWWTMGVNLRRDKLRHNTICDVIETDGLTVEVVAQTQRQRHMHSDVWEQWHRLSGSSEHSLVRVDRWESMVAAGRAHCFWSFIYVLLSRCANPGKVLPHRLNDVATQV